MEGSAPASPFQAPDANGLPEEEEPLPELVSSREHSDVDSHYSYEDEAPHTSSEGAFETAGDSRPGPADPEDTPAQLQQAMDELAAQQAGKLPALRYKSTKLASFAP